MTKEEELKIRHVLEDIIWMAIRYANGRSTYAPSVVRNAVKKIKEVYPDFIIQEDITIKPPEKLFDSANFESDYLHDLLGK